MAQTLKNYREVCSDSYAAGEYNDCSVKALTLVSMQHYDICHLALANAGRINRDGASSSQIEQAANMLGLELEWYPVTSKTIRTIVRELPRIGRFLVYVNKHVIAVVDGVVQDWTVGTRKRVIGAFKVWG